MRIAMINFTAGGICGGYRQYLRNVIPRISKNPSVEKLICASPPSLNVQDWLEPLSNVKFVTCRPYRFLDHKPDPELNKHLEEFSPDVIFVPLERLIKFNNIPIVNMVKNMAPFMPVANNLFREKLRYLALIIEARIALRKSKRIIAISNSVRNHLIEKWKIPANRVGLVYHGCDLPNGNKTTWQKPALIPEEWEGKFLFTAGSIEPYRGLEDLLHAIKYLISKNIELKGIVIAGVTRKSMMRYWKKLNNWIQKNNLASKIYWTGKLNQNEMDWCYNNCRIFVMTSRIEAFGMIGVEAMSHGCISVVADNPCLPEIFDNAATFYKPDSGEDLANKITRVLSWDSIKTVQASETARKRASEFSWDRTAEQTINELMIASGINKI